MERQDNQSFDHSPDGSGRGRWSAQELLSDSWNPNLMKLCDKWTIYSNAVQVIYHITRQGTGPVLTGVCLVLESKTIRPTEFQAVRHVVRR